MFLMDTQDKTELEQVSKEYPEAYIYLAGMESNQEKKTKYYEMAGQNGVPFGWFRCGSTTCDQNTFISSLKKASDGGITSATLELGDFYRDNDEDEKMTSLYTSVGEVPAVILRLGEYYANHQELYDSAVTFARDTLTGYKSVCQFVSPDQQQTFMEQGDHLLLEYLMELESVTRGKPLNIRKKYQVEFPL
jgi:hypothetical protein